MINLRNALLGAWRPGLNYQAVHPKVHACQTADPSFRQILILLHSPCQRHSTCILIAEHVAAMPAFASLYLVHDTNRQTKGLS